MGVFAMTLGWRGSALRLFDADVLTFPFFLRALTGARRGVFGGEERSESTLLWIECCFALDIMRWRSSVGCLFICLLFVSYFSRVGLIHMSHVPYVLRRMRSPVRLLLRLLCCYVTAAMLLWLRYRCRCRCVLHLLPAVPG